MSTTSLDADTNPMIKDFVRFALTWRQNETTITPQDFDLPDIINILQALGFRITYINGSESEEERSPLRGNKNGIRVVVSCSNSGQRCVVEKNTTNDQCKCVRLPEEDATKDSFWEVTATTPKSGGLVETGSCLVPSLPKDTVGLMSNILQYLISVMKPKKPTTRKSDSSAWMTPVKRIPRRSEPYYNKEEQSETRTNLAVFTDSPARYRSLDTLTAKDAVLELPEPGSLIPKIQIEKSSNSLAHSSPNLKLADSAVGSTASLIDDLNIPYKATALIRNASDALIKVLALIESNKPPASPGSAFEEKVLTASKNIKKLLCTSKPKPSTVDLRAKYKSSPTLLSQTSKLLSVKPRAKYTLNRKLSESEVGVTGRPSSIPEPKGITVKRINKYSHVKSTIPKPGDDKKKITK